MSLKIPVWCNPWKARKRMAEMQAIIEAQKESKLAVFDAFAAEKAAHAQAVQQKISVEMAHEETKAKVAKLEHAIGSLTRWLWVTHRIDERATEHGVTDILKDFPNRK
jgi:hypothetical protein